jgi:tape measure domain-containing protein
MAKRILNNEIFDVDGITQMITLLTAAQREADKLLKTQIEAAKHLKLLLAGTGSSPTSGGGRTAIDIAAKQIAEIERLTIQYNATLTANGQKIIELRQKQAELNKESKLKLVATKDAITADNIHKVTLAQLGAQLSINRGLLSQMTAAQKTGTEAGKALVAQTKMIRDEMKKQNAAIGDNTMNVGNYRSALGGLGSSLKTLIGTYISLSGAQQAVRFAFTNTKELDSLNLAFQYTIPNAEKLGQVEEYLSDVSERYGVNILTLRRSYLRYNAAIGDANVTTKQQQQIFESVTKATSVLGLSTVKTERVFTALEQMFSKNKVSAEELRQQMGDSLPGAVRIMAQALGVTGAELDKMMKKGEVYADVALPKFAAALEKAYGIENINRIDTMAAAQGRFESSLISLIASLEAAGVFTAFFNTLTSIVGGIEKIGNLFDSAAQASNRLNDEYFKQSGSVSKLSKSVLPLISEYENLKKQAAAGVDVQEQMRDVLHQLQMQIPYSAQEFDEYGQIIGINTGKTLEFIEAQRTLRDISKKEALSSVEDALVQNEKETKQTDFRLKGATNASYLDDDFQLDNLTKKKAELLMEKQILLERKKQLEMTDFEIRALKHKSEVQRAYEELMRDGENVVDEEALEKAREKARKAAEKAVADARELARLKVDIMKDGMEKELADLELSDQDKRLILRKNKADETELNENTRRKALEIIKKYEDLENKAMLETIKKKREADIAAEKERIDLMPDSLAKMQAALDLEYKMNLQHVTDMAALDKWYATEKQKITDKGNDEKFASAMLGFQEEQALDKEIFESTKKTEKQKQEFQIQSEIETIQKTIELKMKYGQDLSDTEIEMLRQRMDNLNKELERVSKLGAGGETKSLYEMMGLTFGDKQKENEQALTEAFAFAQNQLSYYMNAKKEVADDNKSEADRAVTDARRVLDAELEARNAGLANNVATAQAEFEMARQNQRKALDEQRKVAKEQRAIEAAQQAVSLVTASAKIWGSLGFPAALPALAIMWGSFIAAQTRAAQLSRRTYGEGMYEQVKGGSHVSGDDVDFGVDSKGRQRRVEGGESIAVFPKKAVSRYGGLIERVVNDIRAGQFLENWQQSSSALQSVPIFNVAGTDTSRMENYLGKLVEQSGQSQYVNQKGQLVKKWGNHTTTYV